jgi:hypothetical protein
VWKRADLHHRDTAFRQSSDEGECEVKRRIAAVAGIVLLLSLALAGVALAQNPTPPTPPQRERGLLWRFRAPENRWKVYDAVAETLNLSPTELFEQLHSGKTFKEVADAQGVDIKTVKEAAAKARVEIQRDAVQQALQDGKITQQQADKAFQRLDEGKLLRPLLWLRARRAWRR